MKKRLRSYPFWVALFSLVGLIVQDAGLLGVEQFETYQKAILLVLVTGGIVIDPTTKGFRDNKNPS